MTECIANLVSAINERNVAAHHGSVNAYLAADSNLGNCLIDAKANNLDVVMDEEIYLFRTLHWAETGFNLITSLKINNKIVKL